VQSGARRTQARHLKVEDLFEEGEDGDDEVSLWIPLWVERMEIQLPGLRGSETERARKGGRTGEGKEVKGDEKRNTYTSCRRPRIGHECDTRAEGKRAEKKVQSGAGGGAGREGKGEGKREGRHGKGRGLGGATEDAENLVPEDAREGDRRG